MTEEEKRMRSTLARIAEAMDCEPDDDDDLAEAVRLLVNERDEAVEALEEREGDMHTRIRAGYDKTIADSWRAKVAEVERERDAARSQVKAWQSEELSRRTERDEARAEAARLREALRAIAAGFDPITGSVDDPSAKQVDGYFRGYAMAALEKGGK